MWKVSPSGGAVVGVGDETVGQTVPRVGGDFDAMVVAAESASHDFGSHRTLSGSRGQTHLAGTDRDQTAAAAGRFAIAELGDIGDGTDGVERGELSLAPDAGDQRGRPARQGR